MGKDIGSPCQGGLVWASASSSSPLTASSTFISFPLVPRSGQSSWLQTCRALCIFFLSPFFSLCVDLCLSLQSHEPVPTPPTLPGSGSIFFSFSPVSSVSFVLSSVPKPEVLHPLSQSALCCRRDASVTRDISLAQFGMSLGTGVGSASGEGGKCQQGTVLVTWLHFEAQQKEDNGCGSGVLFKRLPPMIQGLLQDPNFLIPPPQGQGFS